MTRPAAIVSMPVQQQPTVSAVIHQCATQVVFADWCDPGRRCVQSAHPVQDAIDTLDPECAGTRFIEITTEQSPASVAPVPQDVTIKGTHDVIIRAAQNTYLGTVRIEGSAGVVLDGLRAQEIVLDSAVGVSVLGTSGADMIRITLAGSGLNEALIDSANGSDHVRLSVHNPLLHLQICDSGSDEVDTDEILDFTYSSMTITGNDVHIGEHGVIRRADMEQHSVFTFGSVTVLSSSVGLHTKIVGLQHVRILGTIEGSHSWLDVRGDQGVFLAETSQIQMLAGRVKLNSQNGQIFVHHHAVVATPSWSSGTQSGFIGLDGSSVLIEGSLAAPSILGPHSGSKRFETFCLPLTDVRLDSFLEPGIGGVVTVQGSDIKLDGYAFVDVSGMSGAGTIQFGGGLGGLGLAPANTTMVNNNAVLISSAIITGTGGLMTIWAQKDLRFLGTGIGRGGLFFGSGAFMEISTMGRLGFDGKIDLQGVSHHQEECDGMLLLDPDSVVIGSGPANDGNGGTSNLGPTVAEGAGQCSVPTCASGGNVHITATSIVSNLATTAVSIASAGTIQVQAHYDN